MSDKKKIKELEKKAEEYLAGWQRARADYENLQKESQQKQIALSETIKTDLINKLLPILNSFNQAFKSVPNDKANDSWIKGFEFIKKQFEQALKEWGIEPIKTIGEKFDHNLHEAVAEQESDKESGIIIKEVMPGFKLNKKTIVFAKVIVSK